MARFFFSLHRGEQCMRDPEGTVLANPLEAREEAILIARDLLGPSRKPDTTWSGWSISVREEEGETFLNLPLIEAAGLENNRINDGANIISFPRVRLPQPYTLAAIRKLHNEVYGHLLSFSTLVDRQRYARAKLSHEIHAGREVVRQARQLVARSRTQSHEVV